MLEIQYLSGKEEFHQLEFTIEILRLGKSYEISMHHPIVME